MGYIISFIDRKFLRENLFDVEIKKMFISMIVKGIDNKKHSVSEYVKIKIYLSNKNGVIALIKRELYIVDDLIIKAFIEIDIIKLKDIVLNLKHDIIRIDAYQNHEVPIIIIIGGSRINVIIYNKKRINILSYSNVVVPMIGFSKTRLMLSKDRDFLFESQTLNTFSAYAHIIDHILSTVFVRNDIDELITLSRRQKFDKISEYDAADCFFVSLENHNLIIKAPKR